MSATLTFHPLGNADCTRMDLADGRKVLIDYADMKNRADSYDTRIDLPEALRKDLRAASRDYFDVVLFTHLDADHTKGSSDFFWFDHATKYQGSGRTKIRELWVPAAAICEDGVEDCARVIRQEARHRLKNGYGIKVFSRPERLKSWLEANGLTLESRQHLIVDAGQTVPGFNLTGPERAEFFIHSPFAWRQNDKEVVDRNSDSVVFQTTFMEGSRATYALFASDINHETITEIVQTTKSHKREDRLLWDIYKIPHHCSYKSIGPDKGEDQTEPVEEVAWLCETQGRKNGLIISTSDPMPTKGSDEDKDVQPPHREAGNYYESVVDDRDGEFAVTMAWPNVAKPRPMEVRIDHRGATLLSGSAITAVGGSAAVTSTPVRAG